MRNGLRVQGIIASHKNGSVGELLQHMEIAVPLLLQTASTDLLQFAVLKPSQNPSKTRIPGSLVSRTDQETLGSFV